MRLLTIMLSILTVGVLAYAGFKFKERSETPEIQVVGDTIYDAGVVSSKKPLVHVFKIVNPHAFPVTLQEPVSGCDCTKVSLSANAIPAHGSAAVTVSVEPEGKNINGSAAITAAYNGKHSETWLFVKGVPSTAAH